MSPREAREAMAVSYAAVLRAVAATEAAGGPRHDALARARAEIDGVLAATTAYVLARAEHALRWSEEARGKSASDQAYDVVLSRADEPARPVVPNLPEAVPSSQPSSQLPFRIAKPLRTPPSARVSRPVASAPSVADLAVEADRVERLARAREIMKTAVPVAAPGRRGQRVDRPGYWSDGTPHGADEIDEQIPW